MLPEPVPDRAGQHRGQRGAAVDRRAALQIVFCELGAPTGKSAFGTYEYLRGQLAAQGVPIGQVRFMHEARNDKEKAQLFADARAGKVAVLIGTTELMGVGTNVQKRAIALHHLDCPWRPADVGPVGRPDHPAEASQHQQLRQHSPQEKGHEGNPNASASSKTRRRTV